MKRLLFSLISVIVPSIIAFAQPKRVAVYVIGEDAGMNKVLGTKLQTAIARSEGYSAVERTAEFLAELSKEQKYQRTGAVDDSDISRLGKQFGVQYVCVAAVSEAFSEKYISARLIDVESAQVEGTASSSGAIRSLPDIMTAANTVSDELLSSLRNDGGSNLKKVAVYIVKNDAAKNIGRVLGDKLVAGFTSSGRYVAIERTNGFLAQLGKEQKYQRTGAVDDNDISRLGKQFGVQYVCVADVSDVFGEKFISARLIDVETAEIVNSHDAGGAISRMDDCVRIANEISSNLSKGTFKEQAENDPKHKEKRIKEKVRETQVEVHVYGNAYGFVNLGLPSGTLWKATSEDGFYDYITALAKFGSQLPSKEQWEELIKYCKWMWNGYGCKFTGPNGNVIYLPALGFPYSTGKVECVGFAGLFWSSTPCNPDDGMYIFSISQEDVHVGVGRRSDPHSVFLVSK